MSIQVQLASLVIVAAITAVAAQTPSPSPTPRPKLLRVSQEIMDQYSIRHNNAVYPPEAKRKGITGEVTVSFIVDPRGHVRDVKVVKGDPVLAPAAVAAARQWTYQPYMLDGEYIEVETTGVVKFR